MHAYQFYVLIFYLIKIYILCQNLLQFVYIYYFSFISCIIRDGTIVSTLAVSRLLMVFDYMVHLLSGERNSLHFKKLLEQVRICV